MGPDQILKRCIMGHEVEAVIREAHEGVATKHQGTKSTSRKILLASLWWPTIFEDV